VAGLEEVSSGSVRIGDRVVNDLPPKDRDVAMVFQNYALYPHMSVYDNMAFALKLRKMSKDEISRRVNDAAGILGLTEYLHPQPKALSGGQRQRVAMGRALVREPQAFLMDEPLSNLDAKLRVQIRPEDLQDASLAPDGPRSRHMTARVDLLEALGSEVLAHFTVDAPPVVTDDTKELVRDLGTTAQLEARAAEGTSSFVARLDPRTPARRGELLEMAVDVERMHFFDLDDGRSIFDD
jgi:ABC-type sugar transport system ATPase subunit